MIMKRFNSLPMIERADIIDEVKQMYPHSCSERQVLLALYTINPEVFETLTGWHLAKLERPFLLELFSEIRNLRRTKNYHEKPKKSSNKNTRNQPESIS